MHYHTTSSSPSLPPSLYTCLSYRLIHCGYMWGTVGFCMYYGLSYLDKYATRACVLCTSWSVLEFCTVSPFSRQRIPSLWGSAKWWQLQWTSCNTAKHACYIPVRDAVVTMAGPRGQKVSKVFPISHWPPFFFSCQSLALTSWATV